LNHVPAAAAPPIALVPASAHPLLMRQIGGPAGVP